MEARFAPDAFRAGPINGQPKMSHPAASVLSSGGGSGEANQSGAMLTLFHHPFCPHSRFVRLALSELGLAPRLVEERVWERREEFLALNPEATTPVLIEEGHPAVPGAAIIAEYLDETRGAEIGERRLLPADPFARVEVRRLANWFHGKFFSEVSTFLVTERIYNRTMRTEQGGGPPDTAAI